ncbi:hypothetical protein AAFF_G00394450 [Aldrovandia affinis]|uniref:Uncharacterized protein n=1 Tax=Aldrovandia affinis TaxID=143900 RepID=A0AAD7WKS7_9TELE|nr:hypothetical protein AAFF_G00394450 [Aldrovandia affinis]
MRGVAATAGLQTEERFNGRSPPCREPGNDEASPSLAGTEPEAHGAQCFRPVASPPKRRSPKASLGGKPHALRYGRCVGRFSGRACGGGSGRGPAWRVDLSSPPRPTQESCGRPVARGTA